MTLKYFNTKNVFKAVLELLLEAKNVRTSVRTIPMHLNSPRSDRDLHLNSRPESHLRTVILEKIGNVYIWQKIFSNIKHFYSEITLTGSWGLQIVARPDLTSNNSVFTLRPRFASLWWIEVTLTWLMSVFCRVQDLDIHHFLIKYSVAWFP